MYPVVDVISIGHLSCNPFWGETQPVRPPVATTTLIRGGETHILVDPSLPAELMAARLHERSGLSPDRIDIVFLTSFHPTHRRGLALFEEAKWLLGGNEREAMSSHLNGMLEGDEAVAVETVEAELALLGRTEAAPDQPADGVHLFPSPGVTPGSSALLVSALRTIVVAGDAVLTRDHFERNQVWDGAADRNAAAESLADIYEIADIIIPGHDNMIVVSGGL